MGQSLSDFSTTGSSQRHFPLAMSMPSSTKALLVAGRLASAIEDGGHGDAAAHRPGGSQLAGSGPRGGGARSCCRRSRMPPLPCSRQRSRRSAALPAFSAERRCSSPGSSTQSTAARSASHSRGVMPLGLGIHGSPQAQATPPDRLATRQCMRQEADRDRELLGFLEAFEELPRRQLAIQQRACVAFQREVLRRPPALVAATRARPLCGLISFPVARGVDRRWSPRIASRSAPPGPDA